MDSLSVEVPCDPIEAVERLRVELGKVGFDIITETDVQAILIEKTGTDHGPLISLGACRPPLADEALKIDAAVAMLLPCQVVVRGIESGTRVEVLDPVTLNGLFDHRSFEVIVNDARDRLQRAFDALGVAPSQP